MARKWQRNQKGVPTRGKNVTRVPRSYSTGRVLGKHPRLRKLNSKRP